MTKEKQTTKKTMPKLAEAKIKEKENQKKNKIFDKIKLLFAILIVVASIVAYYSFETLPSYVRILLPIAGVVIALAIVFFLCAFGKDLIRYIRESTQEMRKVVWPDKPTTLRMTITVIIFVSVLAAFIAAADGLVSWVLFDLIFKRG